MKSVNIRFESDSPYVRIDKLPIEDQAAFSAWVFRQTRPVLADELDADGQPATCAFAWDHACWMAKSKPKAPADPFET